VPRPGAWPPSTPHSALPSTLPACDRLRNPGSLRQSTDAPVIENAFVVQNTRQPAVSAARARPSTFVDPSPGEGQDDGRNARTLIPTAAADGRTGRRATPGRTPALPACPRPAAVAPTARRHWPGLRAARSAAAAVVTRESVLIPKRRGALACAGGCGCAEPWHARRREMTPRRSGGAADPRTRRPRRRRRR